MWFSLSALAATWNIPGDYPTIDEALASGQVSDGDVLVLASGVHEGADLGAGSGGTLTIVGEPGAVVVPAAGADSVFRAPYGNITLRDLTIDGQAEARGVEATGESVFTVRNTIFQSTSASSGVASPLGGAVLSRIFAIVHLDGVTIVDSEARSGGALATDSGGTIDGQDVLIQGSVADEGGAIFIDRDGFAAFSGLTVEGSLAETGGAIWNAGSVTLDHFRFQENRALSDDGGAILLEQGYLTLIDGTFEGNTTERFGGAIGGKGDIQGGALLFSANVARRGGAIELETQNGNPSRLDDVAFCENLSTEEEGHVVRLNSGSEFGMQHALFVRNGPNASGPSLTGSGAVTLRHATFFENAGPHVIDDVSDALIIEHTVFATHGLRAQGVQNDIRANAFDPNAELSGDVDPGDQLIVDARIDDPGRCAPYDAFPYPTARELIDASTGGVDDDGSPADLGHLGGTALRVSFWNADQDNDGYLANVDCDDEDGAINPDSTETCNGIDDDCDGLTDEAGDTVYVDADQDGYGALGSLGTPGCPGPGWSDVANDCEDGLPDVNPGNTTDSTCNGIDDDCDGTTDEDANYTSYYVDDDSDGYGAIASPPTLSCTAVPGAVPNDDDCDDGAAQVNPDATEVCDGIDNDCSGGIDDGLTQLTSYEDLDQDGFGAGAGYTDCLVPAGYTTVSGDCDDAVASVNPDATELCDGIDNDCAGGADDGLAQLTSYEDVDGDGFGAGPAYTDCLVPSGYATDGGDCDDAVASVNPDAVEQCDGIDNDCSGTADDNVATTEWWLDDDGDGYGAFGSVAVDDCSAPSPAHVSNDDDCDDADPLISPDADEQCDAVDHDCDGDPLAGVHQRMWYLDVDADGYGTGAAVLDCAPVPNHVELDGDCDDGDDTVHPEADELCDSVDNDCDTLIDDDDDDVVDAPDWFPDLDGDTYGDDEAPVYLCIAPLDHVGRGGDCDDTQLNVNEGAPEACIDGIDNDCDELVDEDDPDYSFTGVEFGEDSDGDGYGQPIGTVLACSGEQPLGWVPMSGGSDCDDALSAVNPGADEVCNGVDDDCNGAIDEGHTFQDYYQDADLDGFGNANAPTVNACARPPDLVSNGLDCDDGDPARHPYAVETCNGIDDNCDTFTDEHLPTQLWYPDADGDGFGDPDADPIEDCADRTDDGEVTNMHDCDDTDADIYPHAPEVPDDGIDADCDGTAEEVPAPVVDSDGDGIPDDIDGDPALAAFEGDRPDPSEPKYGCGCDSSGAPWPLLALAPLLGLRRR